MDNRFRYHMKSCFTACSLHWTHTSMVKDTRCLNVACRVNMIETDLKWTHDILSLCGQIRFGLSPVLYIILWSYSVTAALILCCFTELVSFTTYVKMFFFYIHIYTYIHIAKFNCLTKTAIVFGWILLSQRADLFWFPAKPRCQSWTDV